MPSESGLAPKLFDGSNILVVSSNASAVAVQPPLYGMALIAVVKLPRLVYLSMSNSILELVEYVTMPTLVWERLMEKKDTTFAMNCLAKLWFDSPTLPD